MFSFVFCIVFLIAGYFIYGKFVDKSFGPDDRKTPATLINDSVDYVPMSTWKIFLIQLLNIAGTGPIFGALTGALFGPVAYLWIIFGNIFAGAVHDYMCGMLSIRNNGKSISEIIGNYLGNGIRMIMRIFSVILLLLCGVVFTTGPAELLALLTPEKLNADFWLLIVIIYYFIATFVPVDKVIGRLYPVFGICLIVMAMGVGGSMFFSSKFTMPEIWDNFKNLHPSGTPIWSFLFISVACGAISGFHATQSPIMARCCTSERQGRKIFYGAMVVEGIIALVWCAAGVTCYESTQALLEAGGGVSSVVYSICQTTMGKIGAVLALIGVVICPISSGDTAYRSARLTLADWFGLEQKTIWKRLVLTLPLLIVGAIICQIDYSVVWRYFSWSNQTLAMIVLWAASVYLWQNKKNILITIIPALFMSAVSLTYFIAAPECLGLLWDYLNISMDVYYPISVIVGILFAVLFLIIYLLRIKKQRRSLCS